jgi:uncharacterized phage protein (TIGR02218 family)
MANVTTDHSESERRRLVTDRVDSNRPLNERAATAAHAELRGERAGILGAIGHAMPRPLMRARSVPERWSLIYLNDARASADVPFFMADAFTFTLRSGLVLCYTNVDVTFTYAGNTYLGNSVLIDGLKYKAAIGLDVDQQQITVAARSTDTITGSAPFLQALRDGSFDGCEIERERIFFSDHIGGSAIGSVILFKGRLGTIDQIGRTSAKLTVNSDLVLLDIDMPRNVYQPTCLHTLYDSGCTLVKNAFGTNGVVGAGSTASIINWSGSDAKYQQGSITFTSGVNSGVTANVNYVASGSYLVLGYPLQSAPASGDTFTVYQGCDHTPGTCSGKFNNLLNFRGFPYVPPPQMAI